MSSAASPRPFFIDIGLQIQAFDWRHLAPDSEQTPFLLVHGLASNARMWDGVAQRLAAAGHPVVAINQRGHGQSDKPEHGYDFPHVSADLKNIIEQLDWHKPILAGQSWGGNVLLDFGSRYPDLASGLVFVDGGILDLQLDPDADWETTRQRLTPPKLVGMQAATLRQRIRDAHPDWAEWGIDAVTANFEHHADGTVSPWLSFDRHMEIVAAMWHQQPTKLYPQLTVPLLVAIALSGGDWDAAKRSMAANADRLTDNIELAWFDHTDHDIHVQKPDALSALILNWLESVISGQ